MTTLEKTELHKLWMWKVTDYLTVPFAGLIIFYSLNGSDTLNSFIFFFLGISLLFSRNSDIYLTDQYLQKGRFKISLNLSDVRKVLCWYVLVDEYGDRMLIRPSAFRKDSRELLEEKIGFRFPQLPKHFTA